MKSLSSLKPRPKLIGLLILFSLMVVACQSSAAPVSTSAALPPTGGGIVQVVNNPEFGQILVTSDGLTLYTNTVDTPDNLHCIDPECTDDWPPYTVDTEPTASKEIQASLGTITRPDGSKQVTYDQQPLYTFHLDKKPGDTQGNGFTDLGGTWHVVTLGSPAGTPVESSNDNNSGTGGIQY